MEKPFIPIHRAFACALLVLPWMAMAASGYIVGVLSNGFHTGYRVGKADAE